MYKRIVNWLFNKWFGGLVKEIAEEVVSFLVKLDIVVISTYVGKYWGIGGAILGRRFALTLTQGEPPKEQPDAVKVKDFGDSELGGWKFALWLVSFSKQEWDAIPDSKKVKL